MTEDKMATVEERLDALERRLELLEGGYVADERRGRRARALNMWLRIAIYTTFLLLMVLFLFVFKFKL